MQKNMHNKNVGRRGESRAADFLIENGFQILDRNFSFKGGEVDVIALKDDTVHFVEVKTRKNDLHGHPLEAITPQKLQHMSNTALYYMVSNKLIDKKYMSLDAISILGDEIVFVEGIYH